MKNFYFKKAVLLIAGTLTGLATYAQDYTWIKGTNTINQPAVAGTVGVAAPANNPAARTQMASWKDAAGNFWLFGGLGIASNGTGLSLNDLWKYNPVTNQWALMDGGLIGDQSGDYGTMQVAAASNIPGARYAAVSWTDQAGNFWLFGGNGIDENGQAGDLNDLWKYNVTTGEWAWMNGSPSANITGTYGTMGTPAVTNEPGSREGAMGWADASGNLWLFGGFGLDHVPTLGNLSDLWKYNVTTNEWTWVKGNDIADQNGVYGTLGVAAATNKPGGKSYSGVWTDASGNFWMQGGAGYAATGNMFIMGDLWKYDPATNQWTWMSGSNAFLVNPLGVYGTQGVAAASNMPGGRGVGCYWADALGNLWQLGGSGYGSGATSPTSGSLNDLWKYNIAANQWTWMKGSNVAAPAGVYGTQGTAAALNTPGGRYGAASWTDNTGGLWCFGGRGYATTTPGGDGYLGDLWKFQPCINQTVSIQGTPAICAGSPATLTASGASSFSWSAQQTGSVIAVLPVTTTGYTVQSADANSCGSSASATITVNALPLVNASSSKTLACNGEPVTITATGAATYSWSTGQAGAGITVVATNTNYTVTGTDANGCKNTASVTQSVTTCTDLEQEKFLSQVSLYPNPTQGKITISVSNPAQLQARLYNAVGAQVAIVTCQDKNVLEIDLSELNLESGIYFISISNNGVVSNQKIIYSPL